MKNEFPKKPTRQNNCGKPDVKNTVTSIREFQNKTLLQVILIECEKLIARVATTNRWEAMMCEMMLFFGLRLSELLTMNLYESVQPDGFLLKRGTKDGRSRFVPFSRCPRLAYRQRQLHSRCMQLAMKRADNSTGYEGLSKDQSFRKFQRVLATHRVSTSAVQITYLDLRYVYARLTLEEYMGDHHSAESKDTSESTNKRLLQAKVAIVLALALGYRYSSFYTLSNESRDLNSSSLKNPRSPHKHWTLG